MLKRVMRVTLLVSVVGMGFIFKACTKNEESLETAQNPNSNPVAMG